MGTAHRSMLHQTLYGYEYSLNTPKKTHQIRVCSIFDEIWLRYTVIIVKKSTWSATRDIIL